MEILGVGVLVLVLAMIVDLIFGEPPEFLHPTVWMGRLAQGIKERLRQGGPVVERLQGSFLAIGVLVLFAVPTYFGLQALHQYFGLIPYLIMSVLLLKTTLAIKAMAKFITPIADAARVGDYGKARQLLRNVVRRNPDQLSDQQVLSAAVETIAEGTVDGVTGPIFLYSLLGVPGAVAYRAINTLDSTVGYKDRPHLYIGWFSAKLDTLANYAPARLTGILTVVSSWILGLDWSNCLRVLRRDHARTTSLNAGWSMSAMAGALGVTLEKPGHYALGESSHALDPADITKALRVMKLNVLLFTLLVGIPLMVIAGMLVQAVV
jgi:adenosylcobinamide-phosphate synthase